MGPWATCAAACLRMGPGNALSHLYHTCSTRTGTGSDALSCSGSLPAGGAAPHVACHPLATLAPELPRGVALRLVATSTGYAVFSADPGAAVPCTAWDLSILSGVKYTFSLREKRRGLTTCGTCSAGRTGALVDQALGEVCGC